MDDLAAMLHPWTCDGLRRHGEGDRRAICTRAAAAIAPRLTPTDAATTDAIAACDRIALHLADPPRGVAGIEAMHRSIEDIKAIHAVLSAPRLTPDREAVMEAMHRIVVDELRGVSDWQIRLARRLTEAALAALAASQPVPTEPKETPVPDLTYDAWTVIANAMDRIDDPEWTAAATRWRDEWHKTLTLTPPPTEPEPWDEWWKNARTEVPVPTDVPGLREAVIEYLAADADMPEFADAQAMGAGEFDRRNRRWTAADVALRAALAAEEAR